MDRTALVYKGCPPNHCCCDSALRILPDGEWVTFFMTGGAGEPELANHVVLCRSTDEGETWGDAEIVKNYEEYGCLLSEVTLDGDELVLYLERHNGYFDGMLAYPDGVVDEREEYLHFAFDYNRHDVIYYGAKLPTQAGMTLS
ncbi:MAG: sialidase family protein [Planctomycetota bacterium]|jgi:hypothetical protein